MPPPADPLSTKTQAPEMTNRQREALVVTAQGYLRPYPDYDPRPLTYQQVADLLGLTKRQVMKRVERVRDELVAAHVPGLEGEIDARRPLCEWLLALRVLTHDDLEWLQQRRHRAAVTGVLTEPDPSARPKAVRGRAFPTTTHSAHDAIERIAERTARQVAPALHHRLQDKYGEQWLHQVNERLRREKLRPGNGLRDYRFCLAILVHDPATDGWVTSECRASARELNRLANDAVHRRRLTSADVDRASQCSTAIAKHFPPDADEAAMATTFVPTELAYRQTSHNLVDNNPIQRRGNLRTGTGPVRHAISWTAGPTTAATPQILTGEPSTTVTPRRTGSQRNGPWDKPWSSHLRMDISLRTYQRGQPRAVSRSA
jgi:hypothetical protein